MEPSSRQETVRATPPLTELEDMGEVNLRSAFARLLVGMRRKRRLRKECRGYIVHGKRVGLKMNLLNFVKMLRLGRACGRDSRITTRHGKMS